MTVKHVDVALDCGLVVNPAAVEAQVEGAIVMQGTFQLYFDDQLIGILGCYLAPSRKMVVTKTSLLGRS